MFIDSGGTWKEKNKQAGAELCKAQDNLGLATPALPSKKHVVIFCLKIL